MSGGIAIVGMSGRFPGAGTVAEFWENLRNGRESISRFGLADLEINPFAKNPGRSSEDFVCARGILENVDLFDAKFFGYLPREAEVMDPQHRVFLELCWESLENAGHDAARFEGSIGVYAGCYIDTYLLWNLCSRPEFLAELVDSIQVGSLQTELGNDKDYLATRVAYKLGLRGPAMTIQTACSTSLVAIATACQSLASFQCDMALAGGVTIVLPQRRGYFYKEGGMLSPDGHCRTFDADSAGTVFSNGAAVLVLKRVEDAERDRDTIHAVIRGYATNNDGGDKVSYTAPSVEGQAEVIALAMAVADVDPRTIGYVEAHGTATPVGDPIEIAGLTRAFRQNTAESGFCAIGSVKSNLGHLDVASGAIGVIKTALSVREGIIPPSINFTSPNPRIDFEKTPFYVNTRLAEWPSTPWPRRAGVSSFGVGGTNAHVVLEEAPKAPTRQPREPAAVVLPLSAKSPSALRAYCRDIALALESPSAPSLDDVAYTLQLGRKAFEHRTVVVARTREAALSEFRKRSVQHDLEARVSPKGTTWLFPGQGAQYPGMAGDLYHASAPFREAFDECLVYLDEWGVDSKRFRELLIRTHDRAGPEWESASSELAMTAHAQPAIFIMQAGVVAALRDVGLHPDAVAGHSVGEFAAAYAAGVFSLRDALFLVKERGRLMQAQPSGAMLAVRLPLDRLLKILTPGVSVAAENSPTVTVVSGDDGAIAMFAEKLKALGISASRLVTSHAFHSPMMQPVAESFARLFAAVKLQPALTRIFSTVSGQEVSREAWMRSDYWSQQLLEPVRFVRTIRSLLNAESRLFVEVGPGVTLSTLGRQVAGKDARDIEFVPTGRPLADPSSVFESLLWAVGAVWTHGADIDWARLAPPDGYRVGLPTYPFERKSFWIHPAGMAPISKAVEPSITAPDTLTAVAAGPTTGGTARLLYQQLEVVEQQLTILKNSLGRK